MTDEQNFEEINKMLDEQINEINAMMQTELNHQEKIENIKLNEFSIHCDKLNKIHNENDNKFNKLVNKSKR